MKYLVSLTFRYIESNRETYCILDEEKYNEYKQFFCVDCEFKLYSWDEDLIASILPIMLEANAFEEINWNWDKKLKEEKQILNKIGV